VALGVFASILPDIDVLGFQLGIPYGDPLGHRGASHSLLAAALIGLASATAWRFLGVSAVRVFYPLRERTTIANAQQKQVSFLEVKGAGAQSL
jgi:membrane-bound metal-dependent hydrolase YbcI (DUF457 family)